MATPAPGKSSRRALVRIIQKWPAPAPRPARAMPPRPQVRPGLRDRLYGVVFCCVWQLVFAAMWLPPAIAPPAI